MMNRQRFLIFQLSTALLMVSGSAFAQTVRVVDGDTIKINQKTYRLNGIDAPEAGQKCLLSSGKEWPCGKRATALLEKIIGNGRALRCEGHTEDGYGRLIATCFVSGADVGRRMVREGFAWAFVKYAQDYVSDEKEARQHKRGIWQGKAQPAWLYRADKWRVAVQEAPEGCPIKGNISRNGKIYHAPWSPWYSRTKVSLNKGERWFCSEDEALKAGWRAPLWGH